MITENKINIYKKYNGDADAWARYESSKYDDILGSDWSLIDSLVQDVILLNNQLVSDDYAAEINDKLLASCENLRVIETIKACAKPKQSWVDRIKLLFK